MSPTRSKLSRATTYTNANLMHDLLTGRSISGIIFFLHQTLIQWFAKKQATVETAIHGSKFMVAHQATKQNLDIRYILCMMGIPFFGPFWLFGDSQSVIKSSTISTSALNNATTPFSTTGFANELPWPAFISFTLKVKTTPMTSSQDS
jgi:hypothetical protein